MDRSILVLELNLCLVISTAGIEISCHIIRETVTFVRTDSTMKDASKSKMVKSSH